ncbi:MAG: hypothetical protein M1817_000935 [Caeruleum heppii]|nr:MAG: hypothetical protein M1817_000935 [Caeruleum heppii]
MAPLSFLAAAVALLSVATAQYFPPTPQGLKVLQSKFSPGVTISYKEPGICETTPNVKSYSGYVNLPPNSLNDVNQTQSYNISYFFWFFEARKDPSNAPLTIWFNGGPGTSSTIGLLSGNGPCLVNDDSNSTRLNPYSWNNEVNMLYIDQPVQVGFSYDQLVNGTVDQRTGNIVPTNFTGDPPQANNTYLVGTFSSQKQNSTANSTENGGNALWHFAQTWFSEFPAYKPNNDKVSIWTESYGGRFGPAYAAFFEEQNQKIAAGTWAGKDAKIIRLDTLGLINSCVDLLVQEPYYPQFAYNNTYGISAINKTIADKALNDFTKPNGCKDKILECRKLAAASDPKGYGNNRTVNLACRDADNYCTNQLEGPFTEYGRRGYYDIAHVAPDPFPPSFYVGYLNRPWVQAALGVPVNFTESVNSVYYAFSSTGDYPRAGYLEDLGYLLDNGIKVALAYGDRDYACNWVGGEAMSLALNYSAADDFRSAGYQDLQTNASYTGGVVRQSGNFSFSRVYQAGHQMPSYQPETAYEIFMRATFSRDIATGRSVIGPNSNYQSTGPLTSWGQQQAPPAPEPVCYVLAPATCTDQQYASLVDGSAIVKDYIWRGTSLQPVSATSKQKKGK